MTRGCRPRFGDATWRHFDHGTQRAILKLYRASPPEVLARAGRGSASSAPGAGPLADGGPVHRREFAERYAEALGGEVELELVEGPATGPGTSGPELVDRVGGFLG